MKTLFLSFLTLLAFTACSDAYEQMTDDSAQTRALSNEVNGEKFEFGKMYSVYNIPEDAYNHIPKDTLDMLLFENQLESDSIAFYKGPYKRPSTAFTQGIPVGATIFYGSLIKNYTYLLDTFSLRLNATYFRYGEGTSNASVSVSEYSSTHILETDEVSFSFLSIIYSDCIGSYKPHTALPCQPGYQCDFIVNGKVVKFKDLSVIHTKHASYKFHFEGTITSLGEDYNYVTGYVIPIH